MWQTPFYTPYVAWGNFVHLLKMRGDFVKKIQKLFTFLQRLFHVFLLFSPTHHYSVSGGGGGGDGDRTSQSLS